jgi:hypothetical protein
MQSSVSQLEVSTHNPIAEQGISDSIARSDCFGCRTPTTAPSEAHTIAKDCTAGGKDWSALTGMVLCKKCFKQFEEHGNLGQQAANAPAAQQQQQQQKKGKEEKRNAPADKCCTFASCKNPTQSRSFYKVTEKTSAGNQDWTPLIGKILCDRYRLSVYVVDEACPSPCGCNRLKQRNLHGKTAVAEHCHIM